MPNSVRVPAGRDTVENVTERSACERGVASCECEDGQIAAAGQSRQRAGLGIYCAIA